MASPAAPRLVVAVALSAALAPLNSTMIAVALPDIQRAFQVDSGVLRQCLVTSYLLTSIVFPSVGGKVSDRMGHRRALGVGQLVFATGALLAYSFQHLAVITLARVAMAGAGGIIVPSALALLRSELPVEIRGRAFGVFGAVMSLSAAIGPKLGAALVTHWGWRTIFLANLPVLLVSAALAHLGAEPRAQAPAGTARARFDGVGSGLLGLSLALLVVGTEHPRLHLLSALGALGLIPFVLWERRAPDPLVDFSLFANPAFAFGSLIIALQNLAMYSLLFELPQVGARLFHATAAEAGSALFGMMAAMVVAAPFSGRASERWGPRALAVSGSLLAALGVFWLWLRPLASLSDAVLPLLVAGLGLGLTSAPCQAAALSAVPKEKSGMAAGLTSTLRYMGGMAGLATLGLILSDAPYPETVRQEHSTALLVYSGALFLAALCALGLPGAFRERGAQERLAETP